MSKKELKIIRDEIKELRLLYKNLVDKAIPLEEPTSSDKSAIKKKEKNRKRILINESVRLTCLKSTQRVAF